MNQYELLDLMQTGTVVTSASIASLFNCRQHEANLALNKLMKIEGMSKNQVTKKVKEKFRDDGKTRVKTVRFFRFWYTK